MVQYNHIILHAAEKSLTHSYRQMGAGWVQRRVMLHVLNSNTFLQISHGSTQCSMGLIKHNNHLDQQQIQIVLLNE